MFPVRLKPGRVVPVVAPGAAVPVAGASGFLPKRPPEKIPPLDAGAAAGVDVVAADVGGFGGNPKSPPVAAGVVVAAAAAAPSAGLGAPKREGAAGATVTTDALC